MFGIGMVVLFDMCKTNVHKSTVAMTYFSKFFRVNDCIHLNVNTECKFSAPSQSTKLFVCRTVNNVVYSFLY